MSHTPETNLGYTVIAYRMTSNQPSYNGEVNYKYGVVIGQADVDEYHDKYVVWTCGQTNDDDWTFWNGYYTDSIFRANEVFKYRYETSTGNIAKSESRKAIM